MTKFSASQNLIDVILKECSATNTTHEDLVYSLMMLMLSDMRAFGDNEHQLHNDDGELLLHVRKF